MYIKNIWFGNILFFFTKLIKIHGNNLAECTQEVNLKEKVIFNSTPFQTDVDTSEQVFDDIFNGHQLNLLKNCSRQRKGTTILPKP